MTRLLRSTKPFALAALAVLAACSETTITIAVDPAGPLSVAPRQHVDFTAAGAPNLAFAFTANLSGGSITPDGHYIAGPTGNTQDLVLVSDGQGHSVTVTIDVGPGVTISAPSTSALAGTTIQLAATGGSGTGYAWTIPANVSGGSVAAQSGLYTAGSAAGIDTVKVVDSLGNEATKALTVVVPLAITATPASVPPRGAATVSSVGGSGTKTFALTTNLSGGTIDAATGAYVAGATGSVTDTVSVTDGAGASASTGIAVGPGVTLAGIPADDQPTRVKLTLSATGGQGPYTYELVTAASGGAIVGALYTAGATANQIDDVKATDALGNSAAGSVHIGAPLAITGPATALAGAVVELGVAGLHGATLAWTVAGTAGSGIDATSGVFTAGLTGPGTDTVTVTDELGNSAALAISVGGPVAILNPLSAGFLAPARFEHTFKATGGLPPYVFSAGTLGSGGAVTPQGQDGFYKAGTTTSSSDVIVVTDAAQHTASTTVHVGPAFSITGPDSAKQGQPDQLITFVGAGEPIAWTILTNSSNAPAIVDGKYTAGHTGSPFDQPALHDEIQGVDVWGNTATNSISIGEELSLVTPVAGPFPPLWTLTLEARGGGGDYQYSFRKDVDGNVVGNHSGGTIAGNVYQAGPTGSQPLTLVAGLSDELVLADQYGNTVDFTVPIGPALALLGAPVSVVPLAAGSTLSTAGGYGTTTIALEPPTSGQPCYHADLLSGSGGQLTNDGGYVYRPGPVGLSVDRLVATDALGATAVACVLVTAGVSFAPAVLTLAPGQSETVTVNGGTLVYPSVQYATAGDNSVGSIASNDTCAGGGACYLVTAGTQCGIIQTLARPAGPAAPPNAGCDDVFWAFDQNGNQGVLLMHVRPRLEITSPGVVPPGATVTLATTGGLAEGQLDWGFDNAPDAGSGPDRSLVGSGAPTDRTAVYTAGHEPGSSDTVRASEPGTGQVSPPLAIQVGPGISIEPGPGVVLPGATRDYQVKGGEGSNYALANTTLPLPSGGTAVIAGTTLTYTAGRTAVGTDDIGIADTLQNFSLFSFTVGPPLAITCDGQVCGTIPPNDTVHLVAVDGASSLGSITWTFVSAQSGATAANLGADGTYKVGAIGMVGETAVIDTLHAVDSLGNEAQLDLYIGPALDIMVESPTATPGQILGLQVSGGKGPYQVALVGKGSGSVTQGSLDPVILTSVDLGPRYQAGGGADTATTDVLEVTDATGTKVQASITVSQRLQVAAPDVVIPLGTTGTFTVTGGYGPVVAGDPRGWQASVTTAGSGAGASITDGGAGVFTYAPGVGLATTTQDTLTFTDGFGTVYRTVVAGDQITQARTAVAGASTQVIDGAIVTYVKPATQNEGAGYFVQAVADGPALFIDNRALVVPQPAVADLQKITASAIGTVYTTEAVIALTPASAQTLGTGQSLAGFTLELGTPTGAGLVDPRDTLGTAPYSLEGKLVHLASVLNASSTAGSGYTGFTLAAFGGDSKVKLRMPDPVLVAKGVAIGCTVEVGPTPLWHLAKTTAQPSAWVPEDLKSVSCPAPTVTISPANGSTPSPVSSVVMTFSQPMNQASVTTNAAAGACTGSLVVTDSSGSCLGGTLSWSADSKAVTFTPVPRFAALTTYSAAIQAATSNNGSTLAASVSSTFTTDVQPPACNANGATLNGSLVISQVYGGAGCGTAGCSAFKNDYVELHNRGNTAVTLTNQMSVQYKSDSSTSGTWAVTALTNVTLAPGDFYLVAEGAGPNGVAVLPTPDVTGTIAMSATAGRVALVNSITALSAAACPTTAQYIDLVGFGATAVCYEGSGPTPAPSTANAVFRKDDLPDTVSAASCLDTNTNSSDFVAAAANPRNTASFGPPSANPSAICACSTY